MLGYSNSGHQATWKIAKLLVTLLLIVCSLPAHNTAAIIKQASSSLTGLHRSSHVLPVFKLHERFCNLIGASRNGVLGLESFDPPMLPGPISLLGTLLQATFDIGKTRCSRDSLLYVDSIALMIHHWSRSQQRFIKNRKIFKHSTTSYKR